MTIETLTEAEREHYEERAAIYERDGGFSRADAEELALGSVLAQRRVMASIAALPASRRVGDD